MPNGTFPSPRQLLMQQLVLPRSIEASLPQGFPALSNILASVASALPDVAPGLGGNGGQQAFSPQTIPNVISSIEAALPQGFPQIGALLGGTTRGARKENGAAPAARVRILGGGYRSG